MNNTPVKNKVLKNITKGGITFMLGLNLVEKPTNKLNFKYPSIFCEKPRRKMIAILLYYALFDTCL